MMLEIVLTDNARFTLQHIFDTIEYKFGEKAADDFLFEVEKTLNLASKTPRYLRLHQFQKKLGLVLFPNKLLFITRLIIKI